MFLQHRKLRRQEIRMKNTISTKDLKSKLDQKQVAVVETLARADQGTCSTVIAQQERRGCHLLSETHIATTANTLPVNWRQWATKTVAHYPEGKQGWLKAGLPVEKAA